MEIWKDVLDYEGYYQISNLGRIKSVDASIRYRHGYRIRKGRILKTSTNAGGYLKVCLSKNDKRRSVSMHRTVLNAFNPNTEGKEQINHIDGVKTNNRLENLEWCTRSENMRHAYDLGIWHPEDNLPQNQ